MSGIRKILGKYRRASRAALLAFVGLLAYLVTSYVRALTAPNSPGWDLRTAEWVRENHMGLVLDAAEWVQLQIHPPSAEELRETELSQFPPPFDRKRDATPTVHEPPALEVDKPSPGEGVWQAAGSTVNGAPALRVAYFHPEATCPDVVVAVARFTPELTRFVVVPGTRDPGGKWAWHGAVPVEERENLLAAFNSGFRLRDSNGGIYVEGRAAVPLVTGAASLIIDQNGNPDIVEWKSDAQLTPNVVAVRQNLELIVSDGKLRQDLQGNHCFKGLFRSGLGVTADHALVYVAGHGLTLGMLAEALRRAGVVRGMETDIHGQWPSFNVFQPAPSKAKVRGTKLLKNMQRPATRYLKPDDRDFVAAFVR